MRITNIYNHGRTVHLFCRDEKGEQSINVVNSFFPYYYLPDPNGEHVSYKGERLRKMIVSKPSEVTKNRGDSAYEADILFTRRFLVDKVDELEKCPIKYAFIDIEVLTKEFPNVQRAEKPISCISIYNSFSKKIECFYIEDYSGEFDMLNAFMKYMKTESFDLWLSWNVKFDYDYLHNRIPDFAESISVIGKARYGHDDVTYPAGISIVDYLAWFKKVTFNREKSYALDSIAQKYLKEESFEKIEFGVLNPKIKEKNINDVRRMVDLEEQKKLITYFDEVRRLAKVEWEDLIWNSRIVDVLLLQEAKNQKVVLPMRQKDLEKEDFEGAYREAFETGAFTDVGKYDLASAYPFAIIDFCLDPANIDDEEECQHKSDVDRIGIETKAGQERIEHFIDQAKKADPEGTVQEAKPAEVTYFKQNQGALLPTVVKKLMILKNNIKKELKVLELDSQEYKDVKAKYEAIKSIVNSAYGVMGNRFFRLYDKRVASATTFIVRSLLKYVKERVDKDGYKVIYVDTDSIFIESKENLKDYLNGLIRQWGIETFQKDDVSIEFDYEGIFEKLFIMTKCRYMGYLNKGKKGVEEEVKGIEAKRKDSTIFLKTFQKELLIKIMDKEKKENIVTWIKEKIEALKIQPLKNISFPCKLARQPDEYKVTPIFLRALRNTEGYEKRVGDPYYYIFMEGKDESKKEMVMAFDEENFEHIDRDKVNWDRMIERNIIMKIQGIFEAMKWSLSDVVTLKPKKTRKKTTKAKTVVRKRQKRTHLKHCYQGEYANSCKYLEDNCPAKSDTIYPPKVESKVDSKKTEDKVEQKKEVTTRKLNVSHSFQTEAEITDRTVMIAQAFGLGIDESKEFTIYDNLELEIKSDDVIYITGDSGSGKSWIVNNVFMKMKDSIAISELKIDDDEILIEGVGKDLSDALKKLNVAGLGDAFLYLRKYKQLSDGQKYRYRIAKFIDSEKDIWILDEFCATLDRTTAKIVAHNFQKIARRLGKMIVCATTHTDLLYALKPSLYIEKGYEDDVKITRIELIDSKAKLDIYKEVIVEEGDREDYEKLKRFHYRQSKLGAVKKIYRMKYKDDVIGALVITYPHLALKGRNIYTEKKYAKMTKEICTEINEKFECVARVVIHPKYRGIGLSYHMLQEYFKMTDIQYIETVAVMANYNPFFEKAGMTRIDTEQDKKRAKRVAELEKYGLNVALLSSKRYFLSVFNTLSAEQKSEVEDIIIEIVDKYKGASSKLFTKIKSLGEEWKVKMKEQQLYLEYLSDLSRANIVYLIKENKDEKKEKIKN